MIAEIQEYTSNAETPKIKKKYKTHRNPVSCVYAIIVNNKVYVGSTAIFNKRKFEHLWQLKKGIHVNPILQCIHNKHGIKESNFGILEKCDLELLLEREQAWMDYYKSLNEFEVVNILPIAGSSRGSIQSQDTCDKKRASMMGKNKGRRRSPEFLVAQSARQKGRIITEEWRQNIANTMKGRRSNGGTKPKVGVLYKGVGYTIKEFADICGLTYAYICSIKDFRVEAFEKKYNCLLLKRVKDLRTVNKEEYLTHHLNTDYSEYQE